MTLFRFEGSIALVTGASRGIGFELAKALALSGAQVVALARTRGGLEDLDDTVEKERLARGQTHVPLTLVPMDLKEGEAIDRLGASLFERFGRLDILVGNAGILGKLSPVPHIDLRLWEETLAINVTAQWRLIRSLDALLRLSPAGRALFLTSGVTRSCLAYWGSYSASKAALEVLVRTYAAETQETPLRVNLLSPGPFRTRMRAQAMPGEDPEILPHPEILPPFVLPLLSQTMKETGQCFRFSKNKLEKIPL